MTVEPTWLHLAPVAAVPGILVRLVHLFDGLSAGLRVHRPHEAQAVFTRGRVLLDPDH